MTRTLHSSRGEDVVEVSTVIAALAKGEDTNSHCQGFLKPGKVSYVTLQRHSVTLHSEGVESARGPELLVNGVFDVHFGLIAVRHDNFDAAAFAKQLATQGGAAPTVIGRSDARFAGVAQTVAPKFARPCHIFVAKAAGALLKGVSGSGGVGAGRRVVRSLRQGPG